jgi:hypothetical protein
MTRGGVERSPLFGFAGGTIEGRSVSSFFFRGVRLVVGAPVR